MQKKLNNNTFNDVIVRLNKMVLRLCRHSEKNQHHRITATKIATRSEMKDQNEEEEEAAAAATAVIVLVLVVEAGGGGGSGGGGGEKQKQKTNKLTNIRMSNVDALQHVSLRITANEND